MLNFNDFYLEIIKPVLIKPIVLAGYVGVVEEAIKYTVLVSFYIYCSKYVLTIQDIKKRGIGLAVINVTSTILLFFPNSYNQFFPYLCSIFAYTAFLLIYYIFVHFSNKLRRNDLWQCTIWMPIVILALFKTYNNINTNTFLMLIGFSYMTFRLCYFSIEVRNKRVIFPDIGNYLAYVFFTPTFYLGPISPYKLYENSVIKRDIEYNDKTTVIHGLYRIIIGITKSTLLTVIFNQLSFVSFFFELPLQQRGVIEFFISSFAYYGYIYCNFSGICDIVIGFSNLLNIRIAENFNNPFASRNIKEFWNRWHITLSNFMNEVVFSTLNKQLSYYVTNINLLQYVIIINIFIVFVLVGLWHGVGLNYLYFGFTHAFGITIVHLYTIMLKRILKRQFSKYTRNFYVKCLGIIITLSYVSASLLFFECNSQQVHEFFKVLLNF